MIDDLWVLGLRANDATGCRPPWMLVSARQMVADLGLHEPAVEAEWRAAMGLTLPEDPLGGDEPWADAVARLRTPEGREQVLTGPLSSPLGSRRGEDYWDHLTRWISVADERRWQAYALSHTYVLELGATGEAARQRLRDEW